ncbi:cytochrome P450 3A11 [Trichonephila inaurata madagascariensis]|uniref:Cytochrome P450 3A11 n=1 Tax=Trichonephila inaurata madagascariensis TaxID=2747483 RepID=A0A8X6YLE5_9ARAC|nr:cytochrome P450 3A11 [Trichonephila inaurata madagascariensis]
MNVIKRKKLYWVAIANDVDPIELVLSLPALCRKMGVPYCIVKISLAWICYGKKTCSCLALSGVNHSKHWVVESWMPSHKLALTRLRPKAKEQSQKPFPFVGSVIDNLNNPLHEIDYKRRLKYGNIYGHFEGTRPVISVGEPSLLRQIFVKDFHLFADRRALATGDRIVDNMVSVVNGENWKRIRTIITPTFTTGKIKRVIFD